MTNTYLDYVEVAFGTNQCNQSLNCYQEENIARLTLLYFVATG